jgi:alkyl sulfatase BDS1-like metallo-beta-lactamase superfamily hydrolase
MADTQAIRNNDRNVVDDGEGQRADRSLVEHTSRLERRLHTVRDGVWCLVGNGLSNQTFIQGPDGVIAIDTGESVEEMRSALAELRTVCHEPVVAVVYTHFHYISGTTALTESEPIDVIWGHERIETNLRRSATEIAPAYGRGLVEQFAIQLPQTGPDSVPNVGLGLAFRMPDHAPFTPGHVPATKTFNSPTTVSVAGLRMEVTPAPSDADDSVTLWFPELGTAVHNIMWPTLFNVFAIRGEEYRDPRLLLQGLDHLHSLGADHLVATHGPPLSGSDEIASRLQRYRDSIQFIWDQTVRWTNRGATSSELAHRVQLPEIYGEDWLTQQHYGIVEHHVRQVRTGLFGFFDGDPANLLPLDRPEFCDRTVTAMGGVDTVRSQCTEALDGDLRWGLHLAALLAGRADADDEDRALLSSALRTVARRTSSANLRSWCLTRALDLDGAIDMNRHRVHRLGRRQVAGWDLPTSVAVLKVMVDPDRLTGLDVHLAIDTGDDRAGLHFRNHIACPTDGSGADVIIRCERATWNDLLTGGIEFPTALASGAAVIEGDQQVAIDALASLDHPAFNGVS